MFRKLSCITAVVLFIILITAACAPTTEPNVVTVVETVVVEVEKESEPGELPEEPVSVEPIRIGVNAIFSGPYSSFGQDYKEGTTLAVEEINAAGGVLGRPIQLYFGDNAADPATGVNSAGKLIDVDKVSAFIGSSSSSVTLAVMPVIERSGVVCLTAGSTNAKITEQAGVGGNIWQFRLNINDAIMAEAFSLVIARENESVVIVALNNDYGRGAAEAFQANLEALDVTITSVEYYQMGQVDYRPMLTKIKGDDPDGMVYVGDAPDAAPLALQMTEMGLEDLNIYGRGTVVSPEFLELTGDPSIWDGAKEVNRWAPSNSDFEMNYLARWGREPRVIAAMPYYAIYVLADAISIAGSDDRAAIRDALEEVNMYFADLGPVVFDDHHQAHPDMFTLAWDNGEIVTLGREKTGTE